MVAYPGGLNRPSARNEESDVTPAPDHGLVRGVRAGVLAVPAVGVAVLAHAVVDPCLSVGAVLAALGMAWPAAVAVLGTRRRVPALVVWLLQVQLATHVFLDWTCPDVTSGDSTFAAHLLQGLTPGVVTLHVLAVLVTGLALGPADAGLWSAHALVRAARRFLAPVRMAVPVPALTILPLPVHPLPTRTVWTAARPVRRGPPGAQHA